jgi:hypothetical protein
MNLSKTHLLNQLEQFIGTEFYYPLWPNVMLTDGTRFLADTAGCFWLMDAITSHIQRLPNREVFTSCRLTVNNGSAVLIIDDGNSNILASQKISYTDFPLDSIHLYACFDGKQWIIMLPSEY